MHRACQSIKSAALLFSENLRFARVKFPLPDLGEKIKEGTVKKLYVKEGERVEAFQKIADVESDKQFTEITAPEDVVIAKIHYQESEVCNVGDLFLEFETEEGSSTPTENPEQTKPEKKVKVINEQSISQEYQASGVVKMYASAYGVSLNEISPSGRKGRILKEDIMEHIQKNKLKIAPKAQIKTEAIAQKQEIALETKKIKMNPYQQGMQKSMTAANNVPHLYFHEKVDMGEMDEIRIKLKNKNVRVTMMGLLTKTFSLALLEHPRMNSTYQPEKDQFQFETHSNHNITLAIDSPNGLAAPNIKNVQNLSIIQIQSKIQQIKTLSDESRLSREHLQGGTICLSNIGTIAGISACPLMVCPQICIVAIGRIMENPIFYNGNLFKKKEMTFSFGCDHRVVDGASVARFSNQWKSILENPYLALAKMH